MKWSYVTLIAITLFSSGCATLNKDECLVADWYQIGYEDAARGYLDTRITSHREACAKHGVAPDFRDYQDGYDEGIIRFCNASNGFVQGKRGYQYAGICPAALESEFLDGYYAGKEIYSAKRMVSGLSNQQRQNEDSIEALQQQIAEKTRQMLADETPKAERYTLVAEIFQMQQDLGALEERNKQIIVELAEAQARLRTLEDRYAFY